MKSATFIFCLFSLLVTSCKKEAGSPDDLNACDEEGLLDSFTNPDGQQVFIYENGRAYIQQNGNCNFVLQYFDPDFLPKNYQFNASDTLIIGNTGETFPVRNNYQENFEGFQDFTDMVIQSAQDMDLYWSSFTLQSPLAPNIPAYNALRVCLLEGTCDFLDNTITLVPDPVEAGNQVIRFASVAPTPEMVTAKASIQSTISYFEAGSDLWFQMRFYVENGIPFTIADFESSYFDESPGPRIVIRDNKIGLENKFGAKMNYSQTGNVSVAQKQWHTLKNTCALAMNLTELLKYGRMVYPSFLPRVSTCPSPMRFRISLK